MVRWYARPIIIFQQLNQRLTLNIGDRMSIPDKKYYIIDGDGESAETSAPDTAIDPAIKLAFEVLSRMIKKEKDEKQLDALQTAVAILAAKL